MEVPPAAAPVVDLVERTESLEVELAATLIYWASHHPYRQVRDIVTGLSGARVSEIIELGLKHRGRHDEALRAFHAGAALRFDILMDIGGFRDMHRHRRVTQIKQGFTALHGYETPHSGDAAGLEEAGILPDYQAAIEAAHIASAQNRLRVGSGSCAVRPLPASDGDARFVSLQNGLRRSSIHQRTPFRAGRPLQLSACRMGNVPGPRAPAPDAGQTHPRDRFFEANRPAATVKLCVSVALPSVCSRPSGSLLSVGVFHKSCVIICKFPQEYLF